MLPLDNRVMEAIAHPKPDNRRPRETRSDTSRAARRSPRRWRSSSATGPTRSRSPSTWPRSRAERGVARSRLRAGRMVAPRPGRPAPLCPQPVRKEAPRPGGGRASSARGATPSSSASSRTEVGVARASLRIDDGIGGRGNDRSVHSRRLQRGRHRRHLRVRVGTGGRRRLLRPVPVQWGHRERRGDNDGPPVLNPALEIAAILAKQ